MLHVGVDLGGTNIKFGLVDEQGRILHQGKVRTDPCRGSQAVLLSIIDCIHSLLAESSLRPQDLASIGIGVPGTADAAKSTVVYAPNIFWENVAVGSLIRQAFSAPFFIAQDTRAAAWAEYLVGAGQGLRGLAAITIGTGIGCGLVINGRIFHGALNAAGEFGHQIVEPGGNRCNCGRLGCLEAYVGGLAIVREAGLRIPAIGGLIGKQPSEVNVQDVYQLAIAGHPQALELTRSIVRYVGMGLVNLINLCSVELISISGGISNAPEALLMDPLIAFVRANAYVSVANKVRVSTSALGEDAPLIGAALLYREKYA
jgi:glucokinase